MQLKKFRVTQFRSIQDTGWIETENITTFVGTNESGKTNILLPLWKLNPAEEGEINLLNDLPRDSYHSLRDKKDKPIFIQAIYALGNNDIDELSKIQGIDCKDNNTFLVSRDFDGKYRWEYPCENPLDENDSANKSLIDYLKGHMPKYVYYSNYGNLDSQIYLPQVITNFDKKDLSEKDSAKVRTLKTLFKYVNLDPKEIKELGTENIPQNYTNVEKIADKKRERDILLSSAASSFTRSFANWWKQGDYTFEFQADGGFFTIWVTDSKRPEKVELESRSTGLQWFFSFYLVFLVESEQHHRNAILLLDEPGLTLHPLAQKDLFGFFEQLAEKNQIMYTTHSPFMVDSNHLERIRAVYIDKNGKSAVSPDLRAAEKLLGENQPKSIYPVHAALGLTVSDVLLINCNPVLVEGESDQLYLSAIKNLLISLGKITPKKEIVFIPTGGTKGIKVTSSIVSSSRDEKPFVIVDGDNMGQKIKKELLEDLYANNKEKVIDLSQHSAVNNPEIEDLFPHHKMAEQISKIVFNDESIEENFTDVVTSDKPFCNQVEDFARLHDIDLGKDWKVKLANAVKKDLSRQTPNILTEADDELNAFIEIFNMICK